MKKVTASYPMLSASVSCMDLLHLEQQIREVEQTDVAFFHYDVVDGLFNQCYILGDILLGQMAKATVLPIEVHLAILEPGMFIERFAKLGANYITIQYESTRHHRQLFDLIRSFGCEPALCYKAETPPGDDFTELAKEAAWILKLTVNPGFSGQTIQPNAIRHIIQMHDILMDAGIRTPIQADGNVSLSTVQMLSHAGASIFTGGSSGLFLPDKPIRQTSEELLSAIRSSRIEYQR